MCVKIKAGEERKENSTIILIQLNVSNSKNCCVSRREEWRWGVGDRVEVVLSWELSDQGIHMLVGCRMGYEQD